MWWHVHQCCVPPGESFYPGSQIMQICLCPKQSRGMICRWDLSVSSQGFTTPQRTHFAILHTDPQQIIENKSRTRSRGTDTASHDVDLKASAQSTVRLANSTAVQLRGRAKPVAMAAWMLLQLDRSRRLSGMIYCCTVWHALCATRRASKFQDSTPDDLLKRDAA